MNTIAKKMYVAPSIKEHVIELEQGIAAGSQGGTQPGTPTIVDEEGTNGGGWSVD